MCFIFFEEYKDVTYGLILVLILIFLPEGLIGGVINRVKRRRVERMIRDGEASES